MPTACYLCGGTRLRVEADRVRDRADLPVLVCEGCGLIFLSSFDHITGDFYAQSGMHGGTADLEAWLAETAADDERRFVESRNLVAGRRVLDVGCGNGGFLIRARKVATIAAGVDPERVLVEHFRRLGIPLAPSIQAVDGEYDVITLFHVLEHVPDPRSFLRDTQARLAPGGRILIEVPNADDALLRVYDCEAFRAFTYWSCHLFSFSAQTFTTLLHQVGARPDYIKHIQRYPLSNHLYWLRHGKPGGHRIWSFLDRPELTRSYEARLAAHGVTDTLFASVAFPA